MINPQYSAAPSTEEAKRIIIDVDDENTVTEEVEEVRPHTPEFKDTIFKTEEKRPLKVHPEDIIMTEQTTPETNLNNQI